MFMLMLATAMAAAAPPPEDTGIDGWHLEKRQRSCFIEAVSSRNTYIKIEQDAFRETAYMSVSATAWNNVVDRQSYQVGISRDLEPRRFVTASGVKDGDNPRTVVIFVLPARDGYGRDPAFISDLRKARTLRLDLAGTQLQINTGGLPTALVALQSCATDINRARYR